MEMEMEQNQRRSKKRKKTHTPSLSLHLPSFDRTTFPLILAASFNPRNPNSPSLIKRILRSLSSLLTLSPSLPLPRSFFSLLPLLLTAKNPSAVSALSLEVLGLAAISSFESNAMVASDEAVVRGLVWGVGSENRKVAKAAVDAVMDLATSPVGREKLMQCGAIEKLLYQFCQVATVPEYSVSYVTVEKESSAGSLNECKVDNFPALVLDAAVILINTSTENLLDKISEELFKETFPLLKESLHNIQVCTLPEKCNWVHSLKSTKNDIATVIFRISMNLALSLCWAPDNVRLNIFGTEAKFINFLLNYWEASPFIIKTTLKNFASEATIFSSLVHSLDPAMTDTIICSVLQGLVSCPPIASDELDINSFISEVKGVLGSPIVYGQDIRVLKSPKLGDVNKELHYFNDDMVLNFINTRKVHEFEEAFREGYTIALRGMEFRSDKIAAVAEGLATLFGQPSVGANIYLTPPGSQGLARHYDDHCVFVWQLIGQKKWRILPSLETLLPRLYEPVGVVPDLKDDVCGGLEYLLNEGDILYIPRGFVHEACSTVDKFSLHLTLGIEVEAPFEWEGFAHIALHCWNEKMKLASFNIIDSRSRKLRAMSVILLHIAIRLIGDKDSTFRKACMVAAFPLSSDTLLLKHKTTFNYIIEKIDASSSFVEAFKCIRMVVEERNEDSVQWMRWLRHLSQEGDEKEKVDFTTLLEVFKDLVLLYYDHIGESMAEFSRIKADFCRTVLFEDACKYFKTLLEKYRKIRRQYMNGLVSLHST